MLNNTKTNATLVKASMVGIAGYVGYKLSAGNIFVTGAAVIIGVMASQAFTPFFLKPEEVTLLQKKNI